MSQAAILIEQNERNLKQLKAKVVKAKRMLDELLAMQGLAV